LPVVAQASPFTAPELLSFTPIDVPGAVATSVNGINTAGNIVGYYQTSIGGPFHAFCQRNGTFTLFDYPGASWTSANGINDSGIIVGSAIVGSTEVGFSYDGTTFTTISVPGQHATSALGISNNGDIVGWTGASIDQATGFELRGSRFRQIFPSGFLHPVYAYGVNSSGEIAGYGVVSGSLYAEGFAFRNGSYILLQVPADGPVTEPLGINDNNVIAGFYLGSKSLYFGFIFAQGNYTSISYPGATNTFASGINNSGHVVGQFLDQQNNLHGFVSSPAR
jgi:uncharacterized membrane protein